ncbi:MAG: HEAT repeat domain-containing protein [Pirellulales bacterium]
MHARLPLGRLLWRASLAALLVAFASAAIGVATADEPAKADQAADPNADLIRMVVELLAEKDKDLRALGLDQVRTEAKGPVATRQFAARLPELAPAAQVGLLSALADRGDPVAKPAVLDLLHSTRDKEVRVAAIAALGSLGDIDDVAVLLSLLSSVEADDQAAARASLVRLRGEEVPAAIAARLKSADAALSAMLLDVLATRRAVGTVPAILEAATRDDPAVRSAAMKALGELATPEHLPGLVRGLLKAAPGGEREAAERCVVQVCSRVDDEQNRAKPLLAILESLSPAERVILLPTLGRVGGAASLPVVEAAIADPDSARHQAGLRALCNWPAASVAQRLIELWASETDVATRQMILSALIRVAPLPDQRPDDERLALVKQVMEMCSRDEDRRLLLKRASAIRTIDTLRFLLPYLEQSDYAQQACESIVELAHHRGLREPNKQEFDRALDQVLAKSGDATVRERARRYKNGQTWVRPKPPR